MSKGLAIGGMILPVIGLFALILGTYLNGIVSRTLQECRTFAGELGQFFDRESSETCEAASSYVMSSLLAIIAGIIMIVIGGTLTAVGLTPKPALTTVTTSTGNRVVSPPAATNMPANNSAVKKTTLSDVNKGHVCSQWGSTNQTGSLFCGTRLESFCNKCGHVVNETAVFCDKYGNQLKSPPDHEPMRSANSINQKSSSNQVRRITRYTSDGKPVKDR